jgi:hypothetical protein
MHYQIISVGMFLSPANALENLAQEVEAAIAMGWEPVGGVTQMGTRLIQPMVKRR